MPVRWRKNRYKGAICYQKCYQDRQVEIYVKAQTVGESAVLGFVPKSDCFIAIFTHRHDGRIKVRLRLCRHAGGEQVAATEKGTDHPTRTPKSNTPQTPVPPREYDPAVLRGG